MRHGTRQLSGKRARHGAGHRRVAGFYSAAWPDIAPPLTFLFLSPFMLFAGGVGLFLRYVIPRMQEGWYR